MRRTALAALGWAVLVVGCSSEEVTSSRLVNIQLTEIDDAEALQAMVGELDARGIRASIMVADAMRTTRTRGRCWTSSGSSTT